MISAGRRVVPGMREPVCTRFKKLLLSVLGPLLLLGAAELFLRLADIGYPTSFLVPRAVNGRTVYEDNPFFGYRFFPERMTRISSPVQLAKEKAPGALRVVVLGESAAMGDPQPEFGLSRFLRALLESREPGRPVEIVNAAMTAINSHVVVEIAQELAAFKPDVVVLYMGNNEVVGPYGPGTVLAPFARFTRARVWASRLRLTRFLRMEKSEADWSGLELFAERRVAADDPRLEVVYRDFRANLRRIIRALQAVGAEIVVGTVAVNLRDCAPFSGAAARRAFDEGRFGDARDLDELRVRADSRINAILREVASAGGERVHLLDVESLFGVAGRGDFVDHVHFTLSGNYTLACAVGDVLWPAEKPWPSLAECSGRLLHTPWSEWELLDGMIGRRKRPPFAGQPGNAEQVAELEARQVAVREAISRMDSADAQRLFREAAEAHPDDWQLFSQWAEVLLNQGDYAGAERALRRAIDELPNRFDLRNGLALTLGYQRRAEDGVRLLRETPGKHGHFISEFLLMSARRLARDRYLQEAAQFAEASVEESPANVDARLELAARYAALGRRDEAEKCFREVLRRSPAHRVASEEFAALLAMQRRWDEADAVLAAVKNDPATPEKRRQLERVRQKLENLP